jgi:hypothetical protein
VPKGGHPIEKERIDDRRAAFFNTYTNVIKYRILVMIDKLLYMIIKKEVII